MDDVAVRLAQRCRRFQKPSLKPVPASPCHDGKEIVGNALVCFASIFVMGVKEPAVISIASSDARPLRAGRAVEHPCSFGAHMTCGDSHKLTAFQCRHWFRPFGIKKRIDSNGTPSGWIRSDCWIDALVEASAHRCVSRSPEKFRQLRGVRRNERKGGHILSRDARTDTGRTDARRQKAWR